MRFPVSNWHPISYRFGVVAAYCSNFGHCVFEPLFGRRGGGLSGQRTMFILGSLESTYSGLFINVNWTFFARCYGWDATSENRSKIGYFTPTRSVWPKISGLRVAPTNDFFTDTECIITFSLTVFTQGNFVADFLQAKCNFRRKMAVLRFRAPLGA